MDAILVSFKPNLDIPSSRVKVYSDRQFCGGPPSSQIAHSNGRVQHTPILPGDISGGYVVSLIDISIGNHRLRLPPYLFKESDGGGMLIDTGTTITRMHPFAYQVFVRYLKNYFSGLKPYDGRFGKAWADLCYDKMAHMPEIPPITYHLDGADLVVSGKNSFYEAKEYFCLGMLTEKEDWDRISKRTLDFYLILSYVKYLLDRKIVNQISACFV
ncbi:hypothetical protein MRB53_028131 [Persea americana]|uniref:Uncharacterized protein n=1 Tax=Persea americana TaxID=3435 RepID=A0ACC2KEN9_PERAE|nr:hypothetical protein MRB53_028131 [Persea americana]